MHNKLAALVALGKYLGMFDEIAAVGRTDAILGRQCCGFSAGSHALGPLVIGILNAREDFLRNIGNPTLKAAHRHDPRAADGGSRRGDRAMIQTKRSG
jgi:hypothetical protein